MTLQAGSTCTINVVFSLSVNGISVGGHLGGFVGGLITGALIVELSERRRMQSLALAGCVLVGLVSAAAAIAVAGGHGLTPWEETAARWDDTSQRP